MTFDGGGRPISGTATSIAIDVGNDGSPDILITGISVAATTLDDSPASFWGLLGGNDVILGPELAQGAPLFGSFGFYRGRHRGETRSLHRGLGHRLRR